MWLFGGGLILKRMWLFNWWRIMVRMRLKLWFLKCCLRLSLVVVVILFWKLLVYCIFVLIIYFFFIVRFLSLKLVKMGVVFFMFMCFNVILFRKDGLLILEIFFVIFLWIKFLILVVWYMLRKIFLSSVFNYFVCSWLFDECNFCIREMMFLILNFWGVGEFDLVLNVCFWFCRRVK